MREAIKFIRWQTGSGEIRLGVCVCDDRAVPVDAVLPQVTSWEGVLAHCRGQGISVAEWADQILNDTPERVAVSRERLIAPVDVSELWAAGITYELSRDAREAETISALNFYRKVYDADRPEIFFKCPGTRVVGPGAFVGLRRDATWHVPEPELTVILDDAGQVFGYTGGNDMTARDVEADNPLYLPQAKFFHHSAAIGPTLVLADTVDPYNLTITLDIWRRGGLHIRQTTSTRYLRRSIADLVSYMGRAWPLAPWTGLMTGTGIVPPDEFALEDGDEIDITIPEIGTLHNRARLITSDWAPVPGAIPRVLRIDPRDNVAVALGEIQKEQRITVGSVNMVSRDAIPFGHKIALEDIQAGDWIVKYGEHIGVASRPIAEGQHVHSHNVESQRGRGDLLVHQKGEQE